MPKVYITSSRWGKEKLKRAFEDAGAEVVHRMTPQVSLIIPTVDEELSFFSNAREWFKAEGVHVVVPPEFAVFTCRDKMEFSLFCGRHGFNTPHTRQLSNSLAKPRFGKGSKGQIRLDSSYIVQEFVDWAPEYSIDYFKDHDTLSIVPRLRLDIVNGESTKAAINYSSRLVTEAKRLGQALGLEGHNVMQCFYDESTVIWTEVNCRYGGGSWLTFGEFNSPKFLIEKYCGNRQ